MIISGRTELGLPPGRWIWMGRWFKNVPQGSICENVDWIHWKL